MAKKRKHNGDMQQPDLTAIRFESNVSVTKHIYVYIITKHFYIYKICGDLQQCNWKLPSTIKRKSAYYKMYLYLLKKWCKTFYIF